MNLSRLQALRSDMEKCFRCSLCKMAPLPTVTHPDFTDACPAARLYHFHGFSGSGKQIMALSLLDGRIQPDPALAGIAFACTACGYCDVACKFIMDAERHRVNMTLREFLVEQGLAPAAWTAAMADLREYGQRAGAASPSPAGWAAGLDLKLLPKQKAQDLLLAGCMTRSDERQGRVARKLARLLLHAGLDLGALGNAEPCCGLPAYWMNHREDFAGIARSNADLLDRLGVRRAIVASGSCFGAMRSKYPEYARAPGAEVIHASELLADLIETGRLELTRPIPDRVTYHDPCYLGRQSEPYIDWRGEEKTALGVMTYTEPAKPINYGTKGVFEPPRRILRAIPGLEFREMYRIREYSFCCGAGGGAPQAHPALARTAALHRLDEARAVGAEKLVTACAHCASHFLRTQAEAGAPETLPVLDVIDLVFTAAGLEE